MGCATYCCLDGPFTDECGVGCVLVGLGEVAGTVGGIVRVRTADEEVDVGIDDDVRVNVGPVRIPSLRADETVRDGNGQSL